MCFNHLKRSSYDRCLQPLPPDGHRLGGVCAGDTSHATETLHQILDSKARWVGFVVDWLFMGKFRGNGLTDVAMRCLLPVGLATYTAV